MCPTLAVGTSVNILSTIPSPALNMGTTAISSPSSTLPTVSQIGVVMFMDLSLSFLVASYPINIAISFAKILKALVFVDSSLNMLILCFISGCSITCNLPILHLPFLLHLMHSTYKFSPYIIMVLKFTLNTIYHIYSPFMPAAFEFRFKPAFHDSFSFFDI